MPLSSSKHHLIYLKVPYLQIISQHFHSQSYNSANLSSSSAILVVLELVKIFGLDAAKSLVEMHSPLKYLYFSKPLILLNQVKIFLHLKETLHLLARLHFHLNQIHHFYKSPIAVCVPSPLAWFVY